MAFALVVLAIGAVIMYLGIKGTSLADFYSSLKSGGGE